MSKQDLRVVKTHRQIDQALLRLLGQMPFSKLKVDQLCREAMINRSTFYSYYQDKYDLLDKYLGRVLGEFEEQVDGAFVHADPRRVDMLPYRRHFEELLRFIQSRREEYLALWQVSVGRNLWGEMTDIVARRILEQLDTQTMDPVKLSYARLYARLFASDLMTLVKWWLEQDHIGLEQVHQIMSDNMGKGLFQAFHHYMSRQQP